MIKPIQEHESYLVNRISYLERKRMKESSAQKKIKQ